MGQVIGDMAAGMSSAMNIIGAKLGLYRAMAENGRVTPAQLAELTGTYPRYVQEWLNNQAAGGYVAYHPETKEYELPPVQAAVLADVNSPAYLLPGFEVVATIFSDEDKLVKAFKTGEGIGWHEHNHRLFFGTESFYRSAYLSFLANEWIPALDGVHERLQAGGKVADIGCGHGASTIIMAQAYPNATFYGFDYHAGSIETAKQRAREAGVADRVIFETISSDEFAGNDFDLICFFDAFHDLGNPERAAQNAYNALNDGGVFMLVEPASFDKTEENLNPIGRLFYAASTALCVPNSNSQEGKCCLGAQAGPGAVERIVKKVGFDSFRVAVRTPSNMVLEAKK